MLPAIAPSSLVSLRLALANRKKAKVKALAIALAEAGAMEALYGEDYARPFWVEVGKADKALDLYLAPPKE
jgi:hypothetical protein